MHAFNRIMKNMVKLYNTQVFTADKTFKSLNKKNSFLIRRTVFTMHCGACSTVLQTVDVHAHWHYNFLAYSATANFSIHCYFGAHGQWVSVLQHICRHLRSIWDQAMLETFYKHHLASFCVTLYEVGFFLPFSASVYDKRRHAY